MSRLGTPYRWLKAPAFDDAYRRAKRMAFGHAIARLHQGAGAAAATMMKIMVDPNVPVDTGPVLPIAFSPTQKSAIETEGNCRAYCQHRDTGHPALHSVLYEKH